MLEPINELVLLNRDEGPIGVLLQIEDKLARGLSIEQAVEPEAVADFMAAYKEAAGTARDSLNAAEPIIARM